MPSKIVDLSARSEIIRDEPWHLHFWESTPSEVADFLRDPRGQLEKMGIAIPDDCRIETTLQNHDWIAGNTGGLAASDGPIIICGVGTGDVAVGVYRVAFYGHDESEVGRHEKRLLHDPEAQAADLQ
ncbi:MAG TPA: hypothetical protein VF715_06565 [Thermoleophilaceae bacterium]|jgi:hypothetical protein